MQVPCVNCPDRHVGCHSRCDRYKAFRTHRDAELAARSKRNDEDAAMFDIARKLRRRK